MAEKKRSIDKKETYTFEEVRGMIEGAISARAATLACFYKVMPKDLFDQYGKLALTELGKYRAQNKYFAVREKGDVSSMVDFLEQCCNDVSATVDDGIYSVEQDEEHALVNMDGKCALVKGWEDFGLSPEEVDYLCQIQGYGDYGQCEALGLKGEWMKTSARQGCSNCVLKITKLNEK